MKARHGVGGNGVAVRDMVREEDLARWEHAAPPVNKKPQRCGRQGDSTTGIKGGGTPIML